MEWISVRDRLPTDCEDVIYFDEDIGIYVGKLIPEFMDGVTHWMPLPNPPKEE